MTDMQALFIEARRLRLRQLPLPEPKADEVLIAVDYAGLNRADLFQLAGQYPAPDAQYDVPGLEVSGRVVMSGPKAGAWQPGDAVCALLSGGGYASHAIAKAAHCLPVPDPLTMAEAAAIPECGATVWMALFDEAQLQPGESVLIHGGASGIGTTAIQMLRATGCPVWVTVGSQKKADRCAALGARPILYREADFTDILRAEGGVDVVLDIVGGSYIDRSLRCLKPDGRLVSLAFLEDTAVSLQAGRMLVKRLRWIGTSLRARSDAQKAVYLEHLQHMLWPHIHEKRFRPVLDQIFPASEAEKALEHMRKYLHCGKILLKLPF